MPLARYFLFVGGLLLALLFVADACLPKMPVAEAVNAGFDPATIRIHSDRKWPERVVFDTSHPVIVPTQTALTVAFFSLRPKKNMMAAPKAGSSGINQMWERKNINSASSF